MAENEQPVEDQFAKDLEDQIRSNEALVRGLKYEYGQQLLRAQGGDGAVPDAVTLAHIKRLESQIQNDKMFLEARALTRRKP